MLIWKMKELLVMIILYKVNPAKLILQIINQISQKNPMKIIILQSKNIAIKISVKIIKKTKIISIINIKLI
jgi:hypothetical protein